MRAHGTHPTRESKPDARRSVQLNHPHLAGLTIKEKCKQTARKPNKGRLKKVSDGLSIYSKMHEKLIQK